MRGVAIFDELAQEYDHWFEENKQILQAETAALRTLISSTGTGLEVGVGTGRFAASLGVNIGVDPARRALQMARNRGVTVCQAFGENLPFGPCNFDFALLVTVDPFVPDVVSLLHEIWRVLKPNGHLILGVIDKSSPLGQLYEANKESDPFYCEARFHSTEEIISDLQRVGFDDIKTCQTITGMPGAKTSTGQIESGYATDALQVRNGHGVGAFVAISSVKIRP